MGRVKTILVKRLSKALLEKYPNRFTGDFEENKRTVNELLITDSKKLKGQVAGHITRLKKSEQAA